ncbi:MAG: chaperonin GroEL [Chloroflexota bacterium]
MPRLVYGDDARASLVHGIALLTRLLEPTLGPNARTVLVSPVTGSIPESLDSAATIARRIYQLASASDNVGAMLLRHLTWRVHEAVGDGTATAAVVAGHLMQDAHQAITAGADIVALRRGLEHGRDLAVQALREQARPLDGRRPLSAVVAGALHDDALARIVAEVLESVGVDGTIMVEDAIGSETEYEYIDGMRWNEGWHSPSFQVGAQTTIHQAEPRILVTDAPITRPEQLVPAIEACLKTETRELFVVTPEISDAALAVLLLNRDRGVLANAVAVRAPSHGDMLTAIVQDLAAWTGARCISPAAGDRFENVTARDLGTARQTWARRDQFGIVGGRGNRSAIRARLGQARAELRTVGDDAWRRDRLKERIGKLAGTAARLLAGATTQVARDELKVRLEAGIAAGRVALRDGVVAGGGAALVACANRLDEAAGDARTGEALGLRLLARALTRPMHAILRNAGHIPAPIIHEARQRGSSITFDVVKGCWIQPWQDGPLDAVAVLEAGITTSVSLAGTVLTSGAIIHRRNPPVSTQP